ncbi:hypothetical protein YC2023_023935 [Brassica napus]
MSRLLMKLSYNLHALYFQILLKVIPHIFDKVTSNTCEVILSYLRRMSIIFFSLDNFRHVLQYVKCGHYLGSLQIQIFFQLALFLLIWTIYFGELTQKWKIITLRGYYGTFGRAGTTNFSLTWMLIRGKRSN